MKFVVIWSEFAEMQLDDIHEYYANRVSPRSASKLVAGIISEPNKLVFSTEIGEQGELLQDREIEYRYLIYKNYKLIYSIDTANGCIKIADVFDTRQNPPKIRRPNRIRF